MSKPVYEVGPFRIDTGLGFLTFEGAPVPLGPRAVGVLALLVERSPEFVPKEQIFDVVWRGLVVEQGNLAVQIAAIRRALMRAPGGDQWIETLPRRGYRFVGPVVLARIPSAETLTANEPAGSVEASVESADFPNATHRGGHAVSERRRWSMAIATCLVAAALVLFIAGRHWTFMFTAAPQPMSVAVLPVRADENDPELTRVAARLTDDLSVALGTTLRSARVIGPSRQATWRSLSESGRPSNVRYVIDGQLQRETTLVLNLRLLDSETHIQLWAHRLELSAPGDHGYLVELTDPVRRALLAAEMTRAQRSVGEAPPDLVSRGWARMETGNYSNASVREALTFFDRALERDPQNVAALVSKALAVKETFDADLRTDRSSIAAEMDDLTRRAIAIDRGDASAWNARSIALFWQGRYDEALEANAEAQRLDPSRHQLVAVRAFLLLGVGAADEALQSATQAMRLARTATEYDARMACWAILALRRYVEAAEQCAKAAALGNGWWLDEAFTTAAFAKAGQIDAARARAARLLAIRPDLKTSVLRAHRYSDHPAFRQWWEGELLDGLTKAGVPE